MPFPNLEKSVKKEIIMIYPPPLYASIIPFYLQKNVVCFAGSRQGDVHEKTLTCACGGINNLLAFVGGGYGD